MKIQREQFQSYLEDYNLKSHKPQELMDAEKAGDALWVFDSGTSGHDDILIHEPDETEEDVMGELMTFFELETWPVTWELERLKVV